jgi:hypothetical protein
VRRKMLRNDQAVVVMGEVESHEFGRRPELEVGKNPRHD